MNQSSENNFKNNPDKNNFNSNPGIQVDFERTISLIHQIEKHLLDLSSYSEKEFLEIGGKLQVYLTSSKELGNTASRTASTLSDEILNEGIAELSTLIEQFRQILSQSADAIKNDKNELLEIREKVRLILDELGGYRRIVKKLRMLGVATKIESARLGTEDHGFNALADNVDNLSSLINEKVDSINRKAGSLIGEIGSTTENLTKLSVQQFEHADIIINNTSRSLKAFERKYNESFQKAGNISENSLMVSKNIRDIVTSIQFHDITRQQMEHVCEALSEAEKAVSTADEESIDRSAEILHDVCELQTIQLRNSLGEFENAVQNIITRLEDVEINITDIFEEASELFDDNKIKDGVSIKTVHEELEIISSELSKNKEIETELANSIISVVNILEELAEYVFQIENIGTEIEIIALNARVKAARSGSNGAGLGVLAEAIQNLSHDAKIHTGSTANVLKGISEASKKLKANVDSDSQASNKTDLKVTNGRINKLMETLNHLESETGTMISNLNSEVNSLRSEIQVTVRNISIHKQINFTLNQAILDLNSITEETRERATKDLNREKHTKTLKQKYTMNIERNIHNHYTNGAGINLNEITKNTKNASEDSLGDNVELF